MSKATGAGRAGIKANQKPSRPDAPAMGVKAGASAKSMGKGHRMKKVGPVSTNAKDPGFPREEAPWPSS